MRPADRTDAPQRPQIDAARATLLIARLIPR
jgi:hypothetical protein